METNKQAHFSEDGKHRYWLLRSWAEKPRMITIIGLNPSTADAERDDATIRSCCRLTRAAGFDGFIMCNLFTFITSSPAVLIENMHDANRAESNDVLKRMIANTHMAICAWGSWSFTAERVQEVKLMIDKLFCFGINADGSPKHPLYLNTNTSIIQFKK